MVCVCEIQKGPQFNPILICCTPSDLISYFPCVSFYITQSIERLLRFELIESGRKEMQDGLEGRRKVVANIFGVCMHVCVCVNYLDLIRFCDLKLCLPLVLPCFWTVFLGADGYSKYICFFMHGSSITAVGDRLLALLSK